MYTSKKKRRRKTLLHHWEHEVEMSESTRRGHLRGIFPMLAREEGRGFRKKEEDGEEFGGCRVSVGSGPKRVPSRV